jgi:SHS2 domain-containing protein
MPNSRLMGRIWKKPLAIITDTKKISKETKKEIKAEGKDLKALLYNFLEEFLFLLDSDNFLLSKIEKINIKKINKVYKLEATAVGDKAEKYETHGDIKAVTYNEMEIKEEKDKVMVQVVVDL